MAHKHESLGQVEVHSIYSLILSHIISAIIRFLIYENYEDPWKIGLFFDDVITGQDDVITS